MRDVRKVRGYLILLKTASTALILNTFINNILKNMAVTVKKWTNIKFQVVIEFLTCIVNLLLCHAEML